MRAPRPRLLATFVLPIVLGAAVVTLTREDGARGDKGELTEAVFSWREADGPLPQLTEITGSAGFTGWRDTGESEITGGSAIADVDGDGTADVVVGGGTGGVYFGAGDGRWEFVELVGADGAVTAVATDDLDADGHRDVLFGSAGASDVVVWGGTWADRRDPEQAERTELPSGGPTSGLVVADLSGDGRPDVLRLGYGPKSQASADVIWVQSEPRAFDRTDLPDSRRRSLAAEVTDVNGDGRAEIWVTRDIGWAAGEDSVYQWDPSALEWTDRAAELGADLAIDGMGVTVADLTGDGRLDAYLSDLGDNELLEAVPGGTFRSRRDVGLARIRPPGAGRDVVSSSWASAAIDLNLDGRLDVIVANGGFAPDADVVNKVDGTTIVEDDPPAILLARTDSMYADVWSDLGLGWSGRARGMSVGDLDDDGDSDVVLAVHGGGVRVLRNESTAPSLRVRPAPGCDAAGASVTVAGDHGRAASLISPHTFLGAHAAELVIGARGPTRVTTRYMGSEPFIQDVLVEGRTTVVVPCS